MPNIGDLISANNLGKVVTKQKRLFIWLACPDCGKERWVRKYYEREPVSGRCIACGNKHSRDAKARRMEDHSRWNGGHILQKRGYVLTRLSKDDFFYPMAHKDGYALEHRLTMARHLDRCLLPWEVVHHKNGIKDDNRIENLELLPHPRFHLVDMEAKKYIQKLENENKQLKAEHRLDRLSIRQRVLVKELGVTGWVYESAMPESGTSEADRIYGVRLDKVVFPKNFVATEVWHCPLGELEILEDRLDRPKVKLPQVVGEGGEANDEPAPGYSPKLREQVAKSIYAQAKQASVLLSELLHRFVPEPDERYELFTKPFGEWEELDETLKLAYLLQADPILALFPAPVYPSELMERARQILLEFRQYLCNTEFAPEPFTKPIDLEALTVEFPAKILALYPDIEEALRNKIKELQGLVHKTNVYYLRDIQGKKVEYEAKIEEVEGYWKRIIKGLFDKAKRDVEEAKKQEGERIIEIINRPYGDDSYIVTNSLLLFRKHILNRIGKP